MKKVITVAFTHLPYDEVMKYYEWHKNKVSDFRIIWDITDLKEGEFKDPKNSKIMPMELKHLKGNLTVYFAHCLTWFVAEAPDYFFLLERDTVIVDDDLEKKTLDFMEKNRIQVMVPWLENEWSDPGHPFNNSLRGLHSKRWGVLGLTMATFQALQYYGQSLQHLPDYWEEIRFPTVLTYGSFQVNGNHFIDKDYFHHVKNDSLTKEQLREGIIDKKVKAVHPIKDFELLDYIQELINEKNNSKKNS